MRTGEPPIRGYEQEKPKPLEDLAFTGEPTRSRSVEEPYENNFQYDKAELLVSDIASRLLMKRQAFDQSYNFEFHPENRFSHSLNTSLIGQHLAIDLGLNEQLVQAIMLSHDIGHPPFGHLGEREISKYLKSAGVKTEYLHERVAPAILQGVLGRNFSREVLLGIVYHSLSSGVLERDDLPQEYRLAAIVDKIAYVIGDLVDLIKLEDIAPDKRRRHFTDQTSDEEISQLLSEAKRRAANFGPNYYLIIESLKQAVIDESTRKRKVSLKDGMIARDFWELRRWLNENLYSKTDDQAAVDQVKKVFGKIVGSSCGKNPCLVFSLLNDPEVSEIAATDKAIDANYLRSEIEMLQLYWDRLPEKDDYSFLDHNLWIPEKKS